MIFHFLSDNNSPLVSRTLLSILADLNIIILLIWQFFTPALTDGYPLDSEG